MEVLVNRNYKHFKGKIVKVIAIAKNTETLEDMVVYTHDNDTWVRPYSMFISKVDKTKYPNFLQEYRFELISND